MTPSAIGGVAVDDDLRLASSCCAGMRYLKSRFASLQAAPASYSATLLAMTLASFLPKMRAICSCASVASSPYSVAQDPEHEHVLALARVADEFLAAVLERHLVDVEAVAPQRGRPSARTDATTAGSRCFAHMLSSRIVAPGLSSPACTRPISTCSLKATTRSVWSPPLRHALGADADADAARAGHAARGRLDLGRDDLGRPDAVAHARGDRTQRLAAALRAFARIADDLDDVLR